MSTISVTKYIPQTPEGYTYDDDGNLTQDARWEYTCDGENRLVAMQTKAGLTPKLAKRRLEFTYDYMGRRALKKVYEVRDEQTFTSTLISTTKFLYDDWNLIAELDKNNTVKRSYTWGTDISGSMQGAGGVGGLLWMEDHGTSKTYFYLYDGNGNVTSLVDADTGEQVADYDYGPFGEPVKNVSKIEQPFRFSTKYRDEETKLYYYGYRYLNVDTGRWLNRDPLEEEGGVNLLAIDGNDFVNRWDKLGLLGSGQVPPPWTPHKSLVLEVLSAKGWNKALGFQNRWFNGPAYVLTSTSLSDAWSANYESIEMNWVLNFTRARQKYESIFSSKKYMNSAAKKLIVAEL